MRIILLIFVIVFFTACEKDILEVTPKELEFAADASEEQFVKVVAYKNLWKVSTKYDWILISKNLDNFSVIVEKHTDINSPRIGSITLKAGNADPVVVAVTQLAALPNTLQVTPATVTFAANENFAKAIDIVTNAENWNAATSAEWIAIEKQGDRLIITPKSINFGSLSLSAEIIVTAGDAEPVTVHVTQETFNSCINYDTAKGFYLGDFLQTGIAWFTLDLYNSSDPMVGIMIEAFCTLPSSAGDFMLDAGTYYVGDGAVRTFHPSMVYQGAILPTFFYDYGTGNHKLVTGGTFTVSLSGSTYTITTNFTGRDYVTGVDADNIRLHYTGLITFINNEN